MNIPIQTTDQAVVATLKGDIDARTAPMVQEKLLPLLPTQGCLVLDMTQVSYLSSAGLRMLLALYRQSNPQADTQSSNLMLVGLSEEIQETMAVTGFLEFFPTCATLTAALENLVSVG